ncbi:MAG TPA: hypothetical protein PKA64_05665 [Myxococcota bacterium]|nr:hypothetical protein [Myxococcota bacterium]
MIHDFQALCALLTGVGAPARIDEAARAVEIAVTLGGEPHGAMVYWDVRAPLLHVVLPLRFEVAPAHAAELALAIVRVNHAIVLPGFGLDADRGQTYFRWVVPRQADGVPEDDVRKAVVAAVSAAGDFLAPLREVAAGALDAARVLDRAAALRPRAEGAGPA